MDADRIVAKAQACEMDAAANVRAFLEAIRACEGTTGPDGYRTLFGGGLFSGWGDHPRKRFTFVNTAGQTQITTAAGAYQFIVPTWDRLALKLGLHDFTPDSQDRAAVELIAEAGALPDVKEGRLQAAIDKCSAVWASLPSSTYPQPKRTFAFASNAYELAGGQIA